jgi:hypothetical protein
MMDFDHVEHAIEEGYTGFKEKIEEIELMIALIKLVERLWRLFWFRIVRMVEHVRF